MVYLYSQLELLTKDDEDERAKSIFQRSVDNEDFHEYVTIGIAHLIQRRNFRITFRLKPGIEFHLFITTSPCGDARIFSLHENPAPSAASKEKKAVNSDEVAKEEVIGGGLEEGEEQSNQGADSDMFRDFCRLQTKTEK